MDRFILARIGGILGGVGLLSVLVVRPETNALVLSIIFLLLAMIPFFIRFERQVLNSHALVLIAVHAALAVAGRVAFASLPSVQATTFIIIMSGLAFGAEAGFMTGALAALVSNMFLGQGPYTLWQMFAWGMVGLTAGWWRQSRWMKSKPGKMLFGFCWGLLYGWILNTWFVLGFLEVSWKGYVMACVTSFSMDMLHALSNLFFLAFFSTSWLAIAERYKRKYGLFLDNSLEERGVAGG
ncbi:ECF transporter S component [Aneurinibacillus aneurinilyticus]|uniref:ECF transporter S component n=1 Tax=Aneurinibacillus aneurinilyticus TaxID=1391 RepID=UPI0023F3AB69|nr:ECF transporter S component [Aneurinibacillus aneurinilyticus]MCI1692800.1 ECF transporter S component [Aneurinibacillus aneurinilyticus]